MQEILGNLSTLGKTLKKFRIDHDLRQKDLAQLTDTTTAFLSAVESGKKKVSINLREKLNKVFREKGASDKDLFKLNCLIDCANGVISLKGLPLEQKKLLVRMASMELTDKQIQQLSELIKIQ